MIQLLILKKFSTICNRTYKYKLLRFHQFLNFYKIFKKCTKNFYKKKISNFL